MIHGFFHFEAQASVIIFVALAADRGKIFTFFLFFAHIFEKKSVYICRGK